MTSKETLKYILKAIDSKHGKEIEVLDINGISPLGDYFVIATGGSSSQVKAMSDEIEDIMTKNGLEPKKIEGKETCQWVLMDYRDIIIHLFSKESREFYSLDKVWQDAPRLELSEFGIEAE